VSVFGHLDARELIVKPAEINNSGRFYFCQDPKIGREKAAAKQAFKESI